MCLVRTVLCINCSLLQLCGTKQNWKKRSCGNPSCLRSTRPGAASQLNGSLEDPCNSLCDSEHCGNVLIGHVICSDCQTKFRHWRQLSDSANRLSVEKK